MIVKNEAHLIVQTLQHLARFIQFDYWAINDNGSTDGTQDLIRGYFKEAGIPGILDETPWQDFAFNRTVAFRAAFGKTDYAFVWDADDEIHGDFRLPETLTADSYMFTYGNANGSRYSRCQLFKNSLRWKYVGVLHEFPASDEPGLKTQGRVEGDYYFVSGRTGARNRDPDKYLKDALILEKAFHEAVEKKDELLNRYAFYTAQSYNSCNRHEKAIEFYKKVLGLESWYQEKYMSCVEIFDQYAALKKEEEGLRFLVESFRYDSKRVEGIYRLIKYYCVHGPVEVAMAYYTLIQKYLENEYAADNIATRLFAKKDEYDFYLPYYMVIVSERLKRFDVFKKMYELIFQQSYLHAGAWWIHNLFHNLQFGIPVDDPAFVEAALTYVDKLRKHGVTLNPDHYEIMDRVVAASRPLLSAPPEKIPPKKNIEGQGQVRVMLTVTTCKRLALFKETMNSMMRTWKDISSIDYFFCVDDNSSAEDRQTMQTEYPFFDYYMKEPAEKGHRESMNVIWNKLREIQPTYWIHMEDDWLYFKQESYVSRGIALLEKYEDKNIHQLVFNREYGLMLKDMNRVSVEPLESGVVLHSQKEVQGPNCAYWPHYSIQPSIVRTKVILDLGNYDSPNAFFERDYANKYGAAGYKTMFFDGIHSLHIGKQHWEKDGQNAYALNGIGQFGQGQNQSPEHPTLVITEIPKNIPLQGTMAEHLEQIIQKIEYGLPFGLIRPSDGEHKILSNTTLTNCDHWTFTAGGVLQQQLMSAIQTVDPALYIGIPCNTCNLPWNCTQKIYDDYTRIWSVPEGQRTYANVFGNANWPRWSSFLKGYAKGFYPVTSGKADSPQIKERFLIDEKLVDRWDDVSGSETERLLRFVADKKGELICFSAGPLSKIWIPACMKHNPTNMYVDAGASIDVFTKGSTNRHYTTPHAQFAKDTCTFNGKVRDKDKAKNLVYFSVFCNKDYFRLAKLLTTSIRRFSSQTTDRFDILIQTSPDFYREVRALAVPNLLVHYIPLTTVFQAACARLRILDYDGLQPYEKILYLDTDIIVKKEIGPLFDLSLNDVLYGLESGTIASPSFGGQFFDVGSRSNKTGFNSGTLLFNNCAAVRDLFARIRAHTESFTGTPPYCMDQPFINYHAIKDDLYDNQLLKPHISLYEDKEIPTNVETSTICHFSYPIGNAGHKYNRMSAFFNELLTTAVPNSESIHVEGATYSWGTNGQIKFCAGGRLETTWGVGVYYTVGPNRVRADWSNHFHVLQFTPSFDSCTSVRVQPLDFDLVDCKRTSDTR
jgi:glycosyltransferase involved in cell wall biosynthesis